MSGDGNRIEFNLVIGKFPLGAELTLEGFTVLEKADITRLIGGHQIFADISALRKLHERLKSK